MLKKHEKHPYIWVLQLNMTWNDLKCTIKSRCLPSKVGVHHESLCISHKKSVCTIKCDIPLCVVPTPCLKWTFTHQGLYLSMHLNGKHVDWAASLCRNAPLAQRQPACCNTAIHLQYTFNVRCQNWQNRPFSRVFLPCFGKTPFFLVFGRIYPPFRVYARIRARLEKTPLYTRFLVHAWVPKSNSSCPRGKHWLGVCKNCRKIENTSCRWFLTNCYSVVYCHTRYPKTIT